MRRFFYYCLLIFLFSIIIGFYYSSQWKKVHKQISDEKNEIVKATNFEEEKIGFNADFILKKYYTKCGHIKTFSTELPIEFVNLTKEEIEKNYSDWNIEEFKKDKLILAQKKDTFCDEHYLIKSEDNSINVYHQVKEDNVELYKQTGIVLEYLSKDDVEKLEEGIYVYGKENLNLALEDFE